MGDQVNFVVTQPKFSLRHYISVADNDARFIIVIASDWLLIVVLYSGPIMYGNMATVSRAYSSISQIWTTVRTILNGVCVRWLSNINLVFRPLLGVEKQGGRVGSLNNGLLTLTMTCRKKIIFRSSFRTFLREASRNKILISVTVYWSFLKSDWKEH